MSNPVVLKLEPVIKKLIWGTEHWVLSAHQNGDCKIINGPYAGKTLGNLWKNKPQIFGYESNPTYNFPLLIKIITANDDLSIQVHPDDHYANSHENGSFGKSECWYILDCKNNASIIIGQKCNSKEQFQECINNNDWDNILDEKPIRPGDFMQINPGTVHAIKSGTKLIEVQQSSDVTYRVYDYNRLQNGKPRDLHIEDALNVIDFDSPSPQITNFSDSNHSTALVNTDFYSVSKISVDGKEIINNDSGYLCMTVTNGTGEVLDASNKAINEKLKQGDSFIVPAYTKKIIVEGNLEIISSRTIQ